MHVLLQAREVEDALEHAFSPVALDLVVAHEGVRQSRCLLCDFVVGGNHLVEFPAKILGVEVLLLLVLLELLVEAVDLLLQGCEQLTKACLAFLVHGLAAVVEQFAGDELEGASCLLLELLARACHGFEPGGECCLVTVERVLEVVELAQLIGEFFHCRLEFVDAQLLHAHFLGGCSAGAQ